MLEDAVGRGRKTGNGWRRVEKLGFPMSGRLTKYLVSSVVVSNRTCNNWMFWFRIFAGRFRFWCRSFAVACCDSRIFCHSKIGFYRSLVFFVSLKWDFAVLDSFVNLRWEFLSFLNGFLSFWNWLNVNLMEVNRYWRPAILLRLLHVSLSQTLWLYIITGIN